MENQKCHDFPRHASGRVAADIVELQFALTGWLDSTSPLRSPRRRPMVTLVRIVTCYENADPCVVTAFDCDSCSLVAWPVALAAIAAIPVRCKSNPPSVVSTVGEG